MRTRPLPATLAHVLVLLCAPACASGPPSDTTLDCTAPDIHHVLQLDADGVHAVDITASVAKSGALSTSGNEYVVRFIAPRDNYVTMFRIDKATLTGTRALYDDEQQPIRGHGGFDPVTCRAAGAR